MSGHTFNHRTGKPVPTLRPGDPCDGSCPGDELGDCSHPRAVAAKIGPNCEHCGVLVREQYCNDAPKPFEVEGGVYHSAARCRDRLAARVTTLVASRDAALRELETARPAIKWVIGHAPRFDAHDQGHARLALEKVRLAVAELRNGTKEG